MLKVLKSFIKTKMHKKKMHNQFLNVQRWQKEMYLQKSLEEKH